MFVSFMLKQVLHLLFPQYEDPFSLSNWYTFAGTKVDRNRQVYHIRKVINLIKLKVINLTTWLHVKVK